MLLFLKAVPINILKTGILLHNNTKIAIITTCPEDWGGSEELWAKCIPFLQSFGYEITVYKKNFCWTHPEVFKLSELKVKLCETALPSFSIYTRLKRKILHSINREIYIPYDDDSYLKTLLLKSKPDLAIISQGINFDGTGIAYICLQLQITYALIAQKAVDFFWPKLVDRKGMLQVYQKAVKAYFISKNNLRLTEEQFGVRFTNAEIHFNPIKVPRNIIPLPKDTGIIKLACIGRMFLLDKGQDILIRILASAKWKERPVSISFIGSGKDQEALEEMAVLLGVSNISFLAHVSDIEKLWEQYHALILPSRSEGMPLVVLEAMACGRTVIVSDAGGNSELVEDGVTGFIGQANEVSFDAAMERAWEAQNSWENIGKNANLFIKAIVPALPEEKLSNSIKNIINEKCATG